MKYLKAQVYKAQNSLIFRNSLYQITYQLFDRGISLLIIPYIISIVGLNKFGIISASDSVIFFLSSIVQFGFDYTASKKISQNRTDLEKINEVYSEVFTSKIILCIITLVLIILIVELTPKYTEHRVLFYSNYLLCIAYIFLPSFLLIGLSDFKFLVITQAFMKVLFLVSTIILLQTESDYYIPRLAFNISCLVGAILSLVYIKLKYNIQYKFSNNIRDSITLIVSQIYSFLSQLLTNSNTHIITIFLSITYFDNVLGKFALSIKITMVLYQVVFQPINKSLFPDMALKYSNSNKNEWNKILKTTTIKISIIVLTILIISYIFVQTIPILIDTSKENIELLNILVITNILWLPWCINSYLGFQNYIIQNKQKTIFSILLITSLIVTIVSLINYQAILSPIQFLVLWIVIEICQSCYHIIRLFLKKTYTQLNEI